VLNLFEHADEAKCLENVCDAADCPHWHILVKRHFDASEDESLHMRHQKQSAKFYNGWQELISSVKYK